MLEKLFPTKTKAGLQYNEQEILCLQVYRNFAYPMRDWSSQLSFVGEPELGLMVRFAQQNYLRKLGMIELEFTHGQIDAAAASARVQGALSQFAVESKLADAFQNWQQSSKAVAGGAAAPAAAVKQAS